VTGQTRDVVSHRLAARVRAEFSPAESAVVLELLEQLKFPFLDDNPAGRERVETAVLVLASGDSSQLLQAAALAEADWRDVLVAAGLADADWRQRVDALLGRSQTDRGPADPTGLTR
jgi:hypothetical protein